MAAIRRAYKKGGKVEGSIWHDRDVFEDGGPTEHESLNAVGRGESEQSAPEEHEQSQEVQSEQSGRTPEQGFNAEAAKLYGQGQIPSWAGFHSGENEAAVNKSAADVAATRQAQAERMSVLNNGVTNAQATAAEAPPSAASAANAAMTAAFTPMGATTTFGQQPPQAGAFYGGDSSTQPMAPHTPTPSTAYSGNPITSATGTPLESILAAGQPKDITQPAFPHTPTPTVDDATHLGGTPATGAAPMTQPMAPHTPTPVTATPVAVSTPAPTLTNTPIAAPAPANVPTPPIPVRDLEGPSFLEGLMGIFGLNTQQKVDKSYKNYTDQGLSPTDAYNKSIGDIQSMRSNTQTSKGSKTHMIQKLMPDGTYQWVEEPFKKGGKVYRRTIGSQMTDHVISKFGAKLPASNYQPTGSKAGRR